MHKKHHSRDGLRGEVSHFDKELGHAGRKAKNMAGKMNICPHCGTHPIGENLGCHHCVKHKFY